MKLLAIFNSLPDIVFLWYDEGYMKHLKKSLSRDDFWKTFDVDSEDILLDVVGQLFSPLIASQKYMLDIGNPYSSITCTDGSIVVIRQFDEHFYVSLCADGEESEWYLQRRLSFFHFLVNAQFGPSTAQLKPASTQQRQQIWKYLEKLLVTWHTLCRQEQIFLVESIEILSVNAELSSKCLQLLGEALLKANKERNAVHSLLLVNNKLLGLYSQPNALELKTSDILLLTVFVKERFRYKDKFVPFSLNRAPPQLASRDVEKSRDNFTREEATCPQKTGNAAPKVIPKNASDSPSSVTEYMSANSTPVVEPSFQSIDKFHTPKGGSPISFSGAEEPDRTLSEGGSYLSHETEQDGTRRDGKELASSEKESNGAASQTSASKSTVHNPMEERERHHQMQIFLRTRDCPYTPHMVDMIQLDSATVLLLISEHRLSRYAVSIHEILRCLKILLLNKSDILLLTETNLAGKFFDKLENGIKKLVDAITACSELQYDSLLNNLDVLKERWESAKQNGLKSYIESDEKELPANLYTPVAEVVKGMKSVFALLFIQPKQTRQDQVDRHARIISHIQDLAQSRLSDCSSYLQVRGQRNITMTAYYNDFPGLVHFIYINRSTNQLIAPSINQQAVSTTNMQHVVKQHVWEMWQYVENHISSGYSSFIIKDGDFIYSYFIWFEDAMGKPLIVQKNPKPNHNLNLTGVMTSDYYVDLIRTCFPTLSSDSVRCYELFCVHIGIVNNKFVTTSCKKLAAHLWETSGEASSPIGLL